MAKWIQKATKKMKKKGTIGAYGKSTVKKNKRNMKKGGLAKKRAVFAENMRKIAAKRKKKKKRGKK